MTTPTLRAYIDTKRVETADWNVTGMGTSWATGGWVGKFKIPAEEYDVFLDLVHEHVFVKGKACSLLEKHKAQSPILVDLDFRYASGGPLRRRFTDDQIRQFVAAYADAINHFFEPLPDAKPLQFFVSLKPAPEADKVKDNHKDGVHIVCPSITTGPEVQYALRGYLLQTGAIEHIFGSTGMINDPQDCLDIAVIQRNNWFLYGACKPDKAYYTSNAVYSAYMSAGETITAENLVTEDRDAWSSSDLIKLLSLRRGHDKSTPLVLHTEDAAIEGEWTQLLQRWGTGNKWMKTKSPKFGSVAAKGGAGGPGGSEEPSEFTLDSAVATAAAAAMVQVSGLSVRNSYGAEEIALAFRLVRSCLDPIKRAKGYHDWVQTGLLLHNIANTEESLKVWSEFSRRVPGAAGTPDAVYKDKWLLLPAESSAIKRGRKPLMMGTLLLWARLDSPATYKTIMDEANAEMALLNSSGTHDSIADLVLRMYRHEFRCTPPKKGSTATAFEWYQYEDHAWRSLMTWTALRTRLGNEVRNVYLAADVKILEREMAATDQTERERLQAQLKNIRKIESQLQTTGFKECVMKEATDKFYDEEFLKYMNQDPTHVGFSNGVLELRAIGTDGKPHISFRPGRPDDCISFQMGRGAVGLDSIPYIPYDPAKPAPEHLELLDFFTKIYPDPVLREYCLTLYSACLEGANHEQKFYIMSGAGGNGKTKIIDLMGRTFGEYQDSLSATALTRKRADAGNANPEFIDLKNKRFVGMVEPEEGEKINTSLMKQLSGQDMLKVRGLYKSQEGFVFTARIFMSANTLPGVSSMDNGTWRRIMVIPHVATFVEEGKPTNPAAHIHPRDPLLDVKINRWRPYFASLLAWYYENHYLKHGLAPPPQVTAASTQYKEENDSFAAFCQESLVKEAGAEVKENDVYACYKNWCKYSSGKNPLQKSVVKAKMIELYGKPVDARGSIFAGLRLVQEGEDVSGNVM
jgi:P4 family phage/plasmid primase-like protien